MAFFRETKTAFFWGQRARPRPWLFFAGSPTRAAVFWRGARKTAAFVSQGPDAGARVSECSGTRGLSFAVLIFFEVDEAQRMRVFLDAGYLNSSFKSGTRRFPKGFFCRLRTAVFFREKSPATAADKGNAVFGSTSLRYRWTRPRGASFFLKTELPEVSCSPVEGAWTRRRRSCIRASS
jgi:hypothetical protein